MDRDQVLYSLNVQDVQDIAREELERELTPEELLEVENKLGDYIDWSEAIRLALQDIPMS